MRYKRIILKIVNGLWAIPLLFFIRLIKPFIFIKFLSINSIRIGHFVTDSVHQIVLAKDFPRDGYKLISFEEPTANDYWATFLKRRGNTIIKQWSKHLSYWNIKIPGGKDHMQASSLNNSRDTEGFLEKSSLDLDFQENENEEGKNWLKSKGWNEGEKFVCLMVRDSTYLETNEQLRFFDWSYHDYRDSSIEDYLPALDWLTDRGVWVIRMGKTMKNQIKSENKRIIDYAFLEDRSDFLDVWLFANCDLCISTGTGPDAISDVFRRPCLFLNILPLTHIISWSNAMNVPKKLLWRESGKELSLKEYIENTFLKTPKDKKIEIKDLSRDEILTSVKECWRFITNSIEFEQEDRVIQNKFWEILKSEPKSQDFHEWIHPKARIGLSWIKSKDNNFLL